MHTQLSHSPVLIYSTDGEFIGYAIHKDGTLKFYDTNIYTEEEREALDAQLGRLNEHSRVLSHWPGVHDPDVQELVNNPLWEPIEKIWVDMVDEENSVYIWKTEPDEYGEGGEFDEDRSVIVTTQQLVPKNPSDVTRRIKSACETVALRRANAQA